jgi:3',5'-cyclic AMP phosphodiesterase CpdA
MCSNVRFAVASDLHIALPHTIPAKSNRFHRVELSTLALDYVLDHLAQLDLDFLLLPGDLTQDGEPDNHAWLSQRLAELPYPVYVIPGNHDFVERYATDSSIGIDEFPGYYTKFGYDQTEHLYYSREVMPGIRLIGLNSIAFDDHGRQLGSGRLDDAQLRWLQDTLDSVNGEWVMVMVHHNVIEHLPGQASNPLGRRYMLENATDLLGILKQAGVQLIFTGHLHVQDIAQSQGIYDIVTGSLISYPHPYRILNLYQNEEGQRRLQVESHQIQSLPGWVNLQPQSREFVGDRSTSFILKLLTGAPLSLSLPEAEAITPQLRYFWADIAHGDAQFQFPDLPPKVQTYFEQFNAIDEFGNPQQIDNMATLVFEPSYSSRRAG